MAAECFLSLMHTPEEASALLAFGETLIADPRGGVTPSQAVERELVALLGSRYTGLFRRGDSTSNSTRGLLGK